MVRYYILIIVATLITACEKKDPLEPGEKSKYPYHHPNHSNPALTPIEKPDLQDEYYDAPQV